MSTAPEARTASLLFIFATVLLDVVGFGLIIPVMPRLVSEILGSDLSQAATTFGALAATYTLMQFLSAPALGTLSDQVGRKPVLLFSLLLTAVAYLGTALAPNLFWLFAARGLAGAAGGSLTVATTYIADISPPEKRAENFGMIGAAFGVGFILGPALGGLLGGMGSRVPFIAAGAVAALNLLYGAFVVPESHKRENRVAFAWRKANPVAGFGLLWRNPVVGGLAMVMFWSNLGHASLHTTWVLFTSYRFNWTVAQTGLSLAVVGVCAAIVQGGLIRRILPALGERRAAEVGLLVCAAAFIGYGLVPEGWMLYPILILGSLGGIAGPAVQGLLSKTVSAQQQGQVQGTVTSLVSLTGVLAPPVANALFAACHGPRAQIELPGVPFFLGAAFFIWSLVAFQRWFARHGVSEAPVTALQ